MKKKYNIIGIDVPVYVTDTFDTEGESMEYVQAARACKKEAPLIDVTDGSTIAEFAERAMQNTWEWAPTPEVHGALCKFKYVRKEVYVYSETNQDERPYSPMSGLKHECKGCAAVCAVYLGWLSGMPEEEVSKLFSEINYYLFNKHSEELLKYLKENKIEE